jgi:drug/metabolite transporter (DMT)-like permease
MSGPSRAAAIAEGLLAAVLFGASAPLAKRLLPEASPLPLSGLLYLGAGLGLWAVAAGRRGAGREAPLGRADRPWLLGVVFFGGFLGPLLLLIGLDRVGGITGSLLLNLEGPLTIALAVAFFGDHLGRREALGALLVLCGASLVGLRPGELSASLAGVVCVVAATACWALDNNLMQRLAGRDPVAVVRTKGLWAGALSLLLALGSGGRLPPAKVAAAALAVGSLGYGASLVLHLRAVRVLGAARQAVLFASAPFVGALLAVPLLGERLQPIDLAAMAVMAGGLAALLRAEHRHPHHHPALDHEHRHVHDEHHQHPHPPGLPPEPHSHPHQHPPLVHDHPHTPDLHHRHDHG